MSYPELNKLLEEFRSTGEFKWDTKRYKEILLKELSDEDVKNLDATVTGMHLLLKALEERLVNLKMFAYLKDNLPEEEEEGLVFTWAGSDREAKAAEELKKCFGIYFKCIDETNKYIDKKFKELNRLH